MSRSAVSLPVGEPLPLPYCEHSAGYYARLRGLPWCVWLDSGHPGASGGRYDILTADPFVTLVGRSGRVQVQRAGALSFEGAGDALGLLRRHLGQRRSCDPDAVFCGGAIGLLGYEFGHGALGLRPAPRVNQDWPDLVVGIYDWAIVVDHLERRSWLVRQGRDPRSRQAWQALLPGLLAGPLALNPAAPPNAELLEPGMGAAAYARGFRRIRGYIHAGDCYQVNFAQRFEARVGCDAWSLYRALRDLSPAPYAALLEYPFGQVLSASPEQFLALRDGQVRTRPIKGTRPRGCDAEQDALLKADLMASAKDRAENLMIVDLLRNDLGRVSVPGSIGVPEMFALESFAQVHHLVSTVEGRLRDGMDALDLLSACFPGGSITGAPKRRVMQIIDELESHAREVYCGSILRLGFDGSLDSSITIRTALLRGERLSYWAGGGIVADSECAAEYQESLDKAAAFLRLIGC